MAHGFALRGSRYGEKGDSQMTRFSMFAVQHGPKIRMIALVAVAVFGFFLRPMADPPIN